MFQPLIPFLIEPLKNNSADYTKGNRFYNLYTLAGMPKIRLWGNLILSFLSKISSGYWNIMDPTNGFTAIHKRVLRELPLNKIDNRYFFESDMLFRLYLCNAIIQDIPMAARYSDEKSNLKIKRILVNFAIKHLNRAIKRIFYTYFLRDFNVGSLSLFFSVLLLLFGFCYGFYHWFIATSLKQTTPVGVVMLAVLPTILGFQLFLFFIQFDITRLPQKNTYRFPQ